jgi:hypothetical protein
MDDPIPDDVSIVGESHPVPFVPGQTYDGVVTLNKPAPPDGQTDAASAPAEADGQVVALAYTPGVFSSAPASVTVPAGKKKGTFKVTVSPDALLDTPVVITATCNGKSKGVSGKVKKKPQAKASAAA